MGTLGKVCVKSTYFCARQPTSVNAQWLYKCLNSALTFLENDKTSRVIALGCDETSVNMGDNALMDLVKADRPWLLYGVWPIDWSS